MRAIQRGRKRHYVMLQGPGAAVPDDQGGFTQTWSYLSPESMYAEITPATARNLERLASNTVQSSTSHIITMDYHSGVNTHTRILFGARMFQVTGVQNVDERNIELRIAAEEVVS